MKKQTWGREDLIKGLHQKTSLSLFECAHVLEEVMILIKEGLQEGREVKIQKFGTFLVYDVKPRMGRNPATGEEKIIPARKTVRFKRSLLLEKSLNETTVLGPIEVAISALE
jgi:integration host factor subunit alpha